MKTPDKLILGVPSKGRLMDQTGEYFANLGLPYEKVGHERGYRGALTTLPNAEVAYLSASEIARHLQQGRIHFGVTGEDLIREHIPDADQRCEILARLGFGQANVVVAVPECWIDVWTIADLEEAAAQTAEVIVDIATTGTTLKANHLKILTDGMILKSQACLIASRVAPISEAGRLAEATIRNQVAAAVASSRADVPQ